MEKDIYYKPVLDDDEYLLESSKTPGRVRGLSRDKNNDPDIPEWIPYVIDDDDSSSSDFASYAAMALIIAELAELTIKYIIPFTKDYVVPYAREHILPKIRKMYEKENCDEKVIIEVDLEENEHDCESATEVMEARDWRLIKSDGQGVA